MKRGGGGGGSANGVSGLLTYLCCRVPPDNLAAARCASQISRRKSGFQFYQRSTPHLGGIDVGCDPILQQGTFPLDRFQQCSGAEPRMQQVGARPRNGSCREPSGDRAQTAPLSPQARVQRNAQFHINWNGQSFERVCPSILCISLANQWNRRWNYERH